MNSKRYCKKKVGISGRDIVDLSNIAIIVEVTSCRQSDAINFSSKYWRYFDFRTILIPDDISVHDGVSGNGEIFRDVENGIELEIVLFGNPLLCAEFFIVI